MGTFQYHNNLNDIPEPFKNYTANEKQNNENEEKNISATNAQNYNSDKNLWDMMILFLIIYFFF